MLQTPIHDRPTAMHMKLDDLVPSKTVPFIERQNERVVHDIAVGPQGP
jgi:hypothetical protein